MSGDDALETRHVVTVFLRHDTQILLVRRSEAVGSYSGRWGAVAGYRESDPPLDAARREIREETGFDPDADVTLVRAGEAFEVVDEDLGTRWVVHPFLFDAAARAVEPNDETAEFEWTPPTAVLRRDTVPALWTSYDRVRPTVASVASDRHHGSATLSLRALEVLRDEAALAVERDAGDWDSLAETARDLREARPAMWVVANRVNRAMAAASGERTPAAVERAATAGLARALAADDRAAARAADRLPDRVATLSRSGTVLAALDAADPVFVLVAESRPGREGVAAAEALASATDATVRLTTDAALGEELAATGVGAVVVGADAVLPDGRLVNKVGTRALASVAAAEGVDCLVVAASDKVATADALDREGRDPSEVYDGDAALEVTNPTFGVTPPDLVDAVVTEDGALDADAVGEVAAAHRERAAWTDAAE